MRVLLVEDDQMIAEAVRTALRQDGYTVDHVADGGNAATALRSATFDILLLDLGLPRRDGLEVLKELRSRRDTTPVIIITARDDVQSRVAGLDAGADDYLIKPFDLDELAARMRSVIRRGAGRGAPVIEHAAIRLNTITREVYLAGQPIALSAREYAVLEALLQRPGAILSRTQLEDRLYGWGGEIESNAVEVYIHSLRRKLGSDAIRTQRGVGYFVPKA
ncbi:MAG TPA: response regulator transcription factor [Steroidobacteraceae bacterium]|nr:response regulator transcription factor [Steroidobacteraceae bacterium]